MVYETQFSQPKVGELLRSSYEYWYKTAAKSCALGQVDEHHRDTAVQDLVLPISIRSPAASIVIDLKMNTDQVEVQPSFIRDIRKPISHIEVGVHTLGVNDNDPHGRSENHAAIYLIHADGRGCTGFDLRPEDDNFGILYLRSHSYVRSESVIEVFRIPASPTATVAQFYTAVERKGLHNFRFRSNGGYIVGCRHWV